MGSGPPGRGVTFARVPARDAAERARADHEQAEYENEVTVVVPHDVVPAADGDAQRGHAAQYAECGDQGGREPPAGQTEAPGVGDHSPAQASRPGGDPTGVGEAERGQRNHPVERAFDRPVEDLSLVPVEVVRGTAGEMHGGVAGVGAGLTQLEIAPRGEVEQGRLGRVDRDLPAVGQQADHRRWLLTGEIHGRRRRSDAGRTGQQARARVDGAPPGETDHREPDLEEQICRIHRAAPCRTHLLVRLRRRFADDDLQPLGRA